MVERPHEGHLGINKTIARAREVLFWPGMTVDLTEKIKNFPVCLENRPSQQPEPLRSHEIPPLPWAKVGTDILHKNRRNYLVTINYYSKFSEDWGFHHVTSSPGYPQSNGQSENSPNSQVNA